MSSDDRQWLSYDVTFLEMLNAPSFEISLLPPEKGIDLVKAKTPPVWYFLDLYKMVGSEYEWSDQFEVSQNDIKLFLEHTDVKFYTLIYQGWPGGFFILDYRQDRICDLAYFGLVKEVFGKGIGRYLLGQAVRLGWQRPGLKKMTVNTNTLDHEAALPLYKKFGFAEIRVETHLRLKTR